MRSVHQTKYVGSKIETPPVIFPGACPSNDPLVFRILGYQPRFSSEISPDKASLCPALTLWRQDEVNSRAVLGTEFVLCSRVCGTFGVEPWIAWIHADLLPDCAQSPAPVLALSTEERFQSRCPCEYVLKGCSIVSRK